MATREENLKKINEELEKLDDEQLEAVAGGRKYFGGRKKASEEELNEYRRVMLEETIKQTPGLAEKVKKAEQVMQEMARRQTQGK